MAIGVVLAVLSVLGLLLSLLALVYPFGRFRTRKRALKAAGLCALAFVLSPILGAIGLAMQGGPAQVSTVDTVSTDELGAPGQSAEAAAAMRAEELPVGPPATTIEAASDAGSPVGSELAPAAAAPPAEPPETAGPPTPPMISERQAEQLLMQALGEEWDALRAQIERLRERGVDLGPTRAELEELVRAGVEPIPASEPARNLAGYRVLAALRPDDPAYAAKVTQYEAATADREESLIASLRVEEDRIDGVTWYHHPHEPRYWDQRSLVWLAIAVPRGGRPQLVMHTHYTADRWLFVHEVKAYHHGYAEVLTQGEFQGDHDTEIWEWRNEVPTEHQLWMLENLARAPDATLRYEGQQYHDDVELSAADKQLILDMLEAYVIMTDR